MIQTILTILIITAAALIILWKIYKYFKYPEKNICNPDTCPSCPHSKNTACEDMNNS